MSTGRRRPGRRTATAKTASTSAARQGRVREPHQQHLRQAARAASPSTGVRAHQAALQAIADAQRRPVLPRQPRRRHQGLRRLAWPTSPASCARPAGYTVTLDPFEFDFVFPAVLEQLTPTAGDVRDRHLHRLRRRRRHRHRHPGRHQPRPRRGRAPAAARPPTSPAWTSAGPNDIALIQRGTCPFAVKAANAQAAGAEAVIIFNQGNSPDARGPDRRHARRRATSSIPVVGASFADGVEAGRSPARPPTSVVLAERDRAPIYNVIAEKAGTNTDNVVMAGAHLDSVDAGPGINDNGSGSAALLETALQMAKVKPVNTVRFAWWGAEEAGLLGSAGVRRRAVAGGEGPDRALHELRHGRLAERHPDGLRRQRVVVPGTGRACRSPRARRRSRTSTSATTPRSASRTTTREFSGRSDYQAFIEAGIPSGGLFTGAEVVKTAEQAAIWGGTAGEPVRPVLPRGVRHLRQRRPGVRWT